MPDIGKLRIYFQKEQKDLKSTKLELEPRLKSVSAVASAQK